jgi:hypothetical protein
VEGVVTTDYVNALGISVDAAKINGVLVVGEQLPSNLAVKSDIPTNVSQLENDSCFIDDAAFSVGFGLAMDMYDVPDVRGVVTIIGGTVNADFVNALGISVDAANIKGSLVVGQLPDTVAEKSDIPTNTSQLENDSGFIDGAGFGVALGQGIEMYDLVKTSGVTTIIGDTVNTGYVEALGISVAAAKITGQLTANQIDVDNLTLGLKGKLTFGDINGKVGTGQLTNEAVTIYNFKENANSFKYVDENTVTTITENSISTAKISADQIEGGTITGVTLQSVNDEEGLGNVEISGAKISVGQGSLWSDKNNTYLTDYGKIVLSSGLRLELEGEYGVRIYPSGGDGNYWEFAADGIRWKNSYGDILNSVRLTS